MQAFVMTEVGATAIVEKPVPEPGPRDVLVRTTVGLLCTSDVHMVGGGIPVPEGRTLGHEAVGVVAKVGSEVNGLRPGDRVATAATTPDWTCADCQRGYPQQCGGTLGAYKFTIQMDGNMPSTSSSPMARRTWPSSPTECPTRSRSTSPTC